MRGVVVAVLLACLALCSSVSARNISHILSDPQYSTFRSACEKTGVASQINAHPTITVLVPPNSVLDAALKGKSLSNSELFDILSYHVLLDYFDIAKFKAISNHTTLSTTLYQTTGQANGKQGFANITVEGSQIHIGRADPGARLSAVVQKEIFTDPYNISVVAISDVLIPDGAVGAPEPSAAPVNLTAVLVQAKNYNTFLTLSKSSGVAEVLQKHDSPPGITLFVPDDGAFSKLPKGVLGKLTNAQEVSLLEFHGLGTFYSSQELASLAGPQQTLASGPAGGSAFQYDSISVDAKGHLVINTGYNKVSVGPTLYSQEPVSVYGISSVLLPTDIFGQAPNAAPAPAPEMAPSSVPTPAPSSAPTPSPSLSPSPAPAFAPGSSMSPPAPPTGSPSETSPESSPNSSSAFSLASSVPLLAFISAFLCFVLPV